MNTDANSHTNAFEKQYDLLTPKRFAIRYNISLFKPTIFTFSGTENSIQYNYCINPYCHNFGKEQVRYEVKEKPRRYKMTGSSKNGKGLNCNDNPIGRGVSQNCKVIPISNWSITEEIKRLVQINSVIVQNSGVNPLEQIAGHISPF